jgi:regulator of sigma E protease
MSFPSNVFSFLGNGLALIFVLSVLIVLHEGGHFAVAKLFRFPVEVFSMGFGKRLFGFRRKETDYRVSLIPLGGYVRVVGMGPDESDAVEGQAGAAPAPVIGTRWQRLLILLAGPGVNLVLALILTASALMLGVDVARHLIDPPEVRVVETGSPAERAGFRPGDVITSVAGKRAATWDEVDADLRLKPGEEIPVLVRREGQDVTLTLRPEAQTAFDRKYGLGSTGLYPFIPAVIDSLVSGYPGEKAGLKPGDRIVSVAGRPVVVYGQVVQYVREATADFGKSGEKPVTIVVSRGGQELSIDVTPKKDGDSWKIGFVPRPETVRQRLGLAAAFAASWKENLRQARMTYETVARLFSGRASMRQLSGPIDIARFSGEAARTGLSSLLMLMGVLSLQLGLLNLLPIPVLDGGNILVTLVESAVRRDLPLKLKAALLYAGVFFLGGVMVVVLVLDFLKNLS